MTEQSKPVIHISDVETFLTCRYKWFYSTRSQHNLRPLTPNKHLMLGAAIHHALAAYYGSGIDRTRWNHDALLYAYDAYILRAREKMLDITEEIEEYITLGRDMLEQYLDYSMENDKFSVIMTEVPLQCEFDNFTYVGTADGIIRDENGGIWVLENKTAGQMPPSSILSYTLQSGMYCWAAHQMSSIQVLGEFRGVVYNILLKSLPVVPKPLKTGGVERRSNISATPLSYLKAVRNAGLNVKDYTDFANTLDKNKFNQRTYINLPLSCLQQVLYEFRAITKDMLNDPVIHRCAALHQCGFCDYKKLCSQALFGRSWKEIGEWDYTKEDNLPLDIEE